VQQQPQEQQGVQLRQRQRRLMMQQLAVGASVAPAVLSVAATRPQLHGKISSSVYLAAREDCSRGQAIPGIAVNE
jgi:hypothetical protein